MAPVREEMDRSTDGTETMTASSSEPEGKADNLWVTILSEVQARSNTKLPSCKQVLVLGDREVGKTTVVAKLQGVEDPKKGSELEYAYIDVRDEYRDDHTRLGVWVLDGDPTHAHLLRFVLSEETFPHTFVVLTVSMASPWGVMEQLHKWASILQDRVDKLSLSADAVREFRDKVAKRWREYIVPGDELEVAAAVGSKRNSVAEDEDPTPPSDLLLTRNLGLDIAVVVTKTDYMSTLEKEHDYREEHFDYMQQWLRKFCLQYGAALFYTSVKEDKNCDLLYKYLVHRIYGFPFRTPALVVEKDAVFVPAGWDNEKKIAILYESMQGVGPDDYYPEVIARPVTARKNPGTKEVEVQCEGEQAFLARQQQLLQQGLPAPGSRPEAGRGSPAGVQKTAERRSGGAVGPGSGAAQGPMAPAKKADPTKPGAAGTSEGVLANFFNSLLSKKTGGAQGAGGAASGPGAAKMVEKAAVRSDAAAELDRLTRGKPVGNSEADSNNASEC